MQPEQPERISQLRLCQNQLVIKYERGQQQNFEKPGLSGMVPALWQDEKGVLRLQFKYLKPNPQIKILEIRDISIEYLPDLSALNCQKISMTNVRSKGIYDFCLGTYNNLVQLDFSSNDIKGCLPVIKAPKLERLSLNSNSIRSIHSSDKFLAFSKGTYDKLLYLNLSHNQLKVFPQIKAPNLKELQIFNCSIQNVEVFAEKQFPSLEILDISQNKLSSLPKLKMPKLKNLNASSCSIIDLDVFAREQYPQLEILDISRNRLGISHNGLSNLPKLKALKLKVLKAHGCRISDIKSFSEGIYPCLEAINLDNNVLVQIYRLNCISLESFQLNDNRIQEIFDFAQGDYPNLVQLYIFRNLLQNLPRFVNVPKLERLDVSQNQLRSLEEFSLGTHPNLVSLWFSHNLISNLPKFVNFPKLERLDANINQLHGLEEFSQCEYPNLQELQLSQNRISEFPIIKSKKLQRMNLSKNQIMQWSGVPLDSQNDHEDENERIDEKIHKNNCNWLRFVKLSSYYGNLIELNLMSNHLNNVEFLQFLDLCNLRRLSLKFNNLFKAKSMLKVYFPQIQLCDLSQNIMIEQWRDIQMVQQICPFEQFLQIDNLYFSIKFKVKIFGEDRYDRFDKETVLPLHQEDARNRRAHRRIRRPFFKNSLPPFRLER